MKKNVKEVVGGLKEKGKRFYEKNQMLIGYEIGVLALGALYLIADKLNQPVAASVDLAPSEDKKEVIVEMGLKNRFGKKVLDCGFKYDGKDEECAKHLTEMNEAITTVLNSKD